MKCQQEMCPFWSGSGCVCEVVDLGPSDVRLAANASEGWAAYAAEQERHAETTARLEDMTREARLSREATEKAVKRSEREALRSALEGVRTHNGTPVTPKNLRWAATHEALCRSYIFDVLTALAEALDD